MVSKEVEST